jgi:hypothetical protein
MEQATITNINYIFKKSIILSMLIFIILFTQSCNDPINPNDLKQYSFSCIIDGGEYKNYLVSHKIIGDAIFNNFDKETRCSYDLSDGRTIIIVRIFGDSIGDYEIGKDDLNNVEVEIVKDQKALMMNSGIIKVTSYGNVGEVIEGTFSGTGIIINSSWEFISVKITNGKFKAIRRI